MKITIITVCYNASESLERTIESVGIQTWKDKEYIIIDGGSNDATLDIIRRHKKVISKWVSEQDKGIYDAMNKGIKMATGEYLQFMNAGDTFCESSALKSLVEKCNGQLTDIIHGNIIRQYSGVSVKSSGVTTDHPGIMDMMGSAIHHQAALINRQLFTKQGLYSIDYKLCSDWKFFFDSIVLHNATSKYVDVNVANFVMDGASSKSTKDYMREMQHYLKSLYGSEIYDLLQELCIMRKSGLCRCYYRMRMLMTNNMSDKTFMRLLNLKRIVRGLLGLKVD